MEVTIYKGKVVFDLAISNAPGHGDINVYAEICDPANLKPLSIIFQKCFSSRIFPDNWKRPNNEPVHKKGKK